MSQWREGDPDILVVLDAGYDAPRIAHLLADLPVEILGRMRSDRVLRKPVPPRGTGRTPAYPTSGVRYRASTQDQPVPSASTGGKPGPKTRAGPTKPGFFIERLAIAGVQEECVAAA